MLSPEYLAGFFDGEGCVTIMLASKGKQAQLRVYLTNTCREILELVQLQFGGKIYKASAKSIPSNWKQAYHIILHSNKGLKFLETVEPFIFVKSAQVKLGIEFQNFQNSPNRLEGFVNSYGSISRRRKQETLDKELAFKVAIKELNRKGRDSSNALVGSA